MITRKFRAAIEALEVASENIEALIAEGFEYEDIQQKLEYMWEVLDAETPQTDGQYA